MLKARHVRHIYLSKSRNDTLADNLFTIPIFVLETFNNGTTSLWLSCPGNKRQDGRNALIRRINHYNEAKGSWVVTAQLHKEPFRLSPHLKHNNFPELL